MALVDFRYVRTGTGELSGPSMIHQTEQAFNELGTEIEDIRTDSGDALETAKDALEKAETATSAAASAQQTATEAVATANAARATATEAVASANAAQETAQAANATAEQASTEAAAAKATAENALEKATGAEETSGSALSAAQSAQETASDALGTASTAQASADAAKKAAATAQTTADSAQTTANKALERAQASDLVDGKTTTEAGGAITVKDVAIGGDLEDLASARGQIGNSKAQGSHDFSSGMLSEKPGMYTATKSGSTNVPFTGSFAEMILGTPTHRGSLLITSGRSSSPRAAISAIYMNEGGGFSGYNRLITEQQVGDGIRVSDGIISVPEYDGATASTAGTAGLVPPAAAGQQESFLTGGGEYKPALTKISDSVNLADSKTAASATAVKAAYDRGTEALTVAEAALPKTGGDLSGQLTINGDSVARAGSNTKFNRTGYSSSPPLVWGGTHDDLVNYNLFFTDQLRVYGANRAGSLCHSGNLDNAKTTTFIWDASIETSYIAAFNSDGSQLHPTSSDSLSVYSSLALSGCVARVAGQAIGLTGTWMVIYVNNNFNIGTSVIDGGSIPDTENKNYVAIRIQ